MLLPEYQRLALKPSPNVAVPNESRQLVSRLVQQRFEFANEERERLTFQPVPQVLLEFEHRARAGTERTVVEKSDFGIEQPKTRIAGGFAERAQRFVLAVGVHVLACLFVN